MKDSITIPASLVPTLVSIVECHQPIVVDIAGETLGAEEIDMAWKVYSLMEICDFPSRALYDMRNALVAIGIEAKPHEAIKAANDLLMKNRQA